MTAGLCPRPLAITPLLAPRSAAVAYCDGALAPLMAWGSLLTERDWADNHVSAGHSVTAVRLYIVSVVWCGVLCCSHLLLPVQGC
jgi:hypothetical protein